MTTPRANEQPASAETKAIVPGSEAEASTLWASDGPSLRTSSVYVMSCPRVTGSRSSSTVIDTSATVATRSTSVEASSLASGSACGEEVIVAVFENAIPEYAGSIDMSTK